MIHSVIVTHNISININSFGFCFAVCIPQWIMNPLHVVSKQTFVTKNSAECFEGIPFSCIKKGGCITRSTNNCY